MHTGCELIGLEDLGVVRMRGPDAVAFLQGQLSNDIAQLSAERSLLAGYHNPQGRTIALLRLVQWGQDDILAVVPRELAPVVTSRLARFILRAKVKIADESGSWRVSGLSGAGPAATQADGAMFVRVADNPPRWLVISPTDRATPPAAPGMASGDYSPGDVATWRRLEVAAGQPQVYAATSEEFVAQMLNLDVLDAIAFDKGCYTGQEVIARAHYRGRVKRRMQRFVSREPVQLAPGDSGQLSDGRAFKVVRAAQLADGRCDFLAVVPLAASEAGGEPAPAAAVATAPQVAADPAALPYSLPD
jgi:folate-binding protein YgfZ